MDPDVSKSSIDRLIDDFGPSSISSLDLLWNNATK